jgi:hypothetical protein
VPELWKGRVGFEQERRRRIRAAALREVTRQDPAAARGWATIYA